MCPELSDEIDEVLEELLVRDLVVRETRTPIHGQHAFKFKHVLIREVAYAGLSKTSRADLHRVFAEWLAEHTAGELLEIRAFHLDQAARLLTELDGEAPAELRAEAAEVLTKAGYRALSRESFRSARKLLLRAVELEPTLERRFAAGRAAWRLNDFMAVLVEMREVANDAEGEAELRGRALSALAEATLWHRADAMGARKLVREALEVLASESPAVRFEPLRVAYEIAAWVGDGAEFEHYAMEAMHAARDAGRKDLEPLVINALVNAYVLRYQLAKAGPLVLRALELAEESGSAFSRATALSARGWLHLSSERFVEAEADYAQARELYEELGNTSRESMMTMMVGRSAFAQGDLERAEKLLREAERAIRGLGDRGSLCESQRSLAMVLAARGKLDEAERYALQARETVGPEDRVSISTTTLALAVVRAAQDRDAEADELFREAIEGVHFYEFHSLEHWALRLYIEFLAERGREDEAARYGERRDALAPSTTAPMS
jgi:tetratricopeptide (TPR) repeat protein